MRLYRRQIEDNKVSIVAITAAVLIMIAARAGNGMRGSLLGVRHLEHHVAHEPFERLVFKNCL
jgi:hypothetical protein